VYKSNRLDASAALNTNEIQKQPIPMESLISRYVEKCYGEKDKTVVRQLYEQFYTGFPDNQINALIFYTNWTKPTEDILAPYLQLIDQYCQPPIENYKVVYNGGCIFPQYKNVKCNGSEGSVSDDEVAKRHFASTSYKSAPKDENKRLKAYKEGNKLWKSRDWTMDEWKKHVFGLAGVKF